MTNLAEDRPLFEPNMTAKIEPEEHSPKIRRNTVNRLDAFKLMQYTSEHAEEASVLSDPAFAAKAERDLGFKVTPANVAGCRKSLGIAKRPKPDPVKEAAGKIEQLANSLLCLTEIVEELMRASHLGGYYASRVAEARALAEELMGEQ